MKDDSKIASEVTALSDVIWDMASKVWTFAELGFKELKSSALESAVLEKHGFVISDRGIGGIDTSWIATWGKGSPTIGILVEFDALPGLGNEAVPVKTARKDGNDNGHGCGHNLIGSGAIGAAIALKNHMEKEKIPGTIRVFGCPAEELLILAFLAMFATTYTLYRTGTQYRTGQNLRRKRHANHRTLGNLVGLGPAVWGLDKAGF